MKRIIRCRTAGLDLVVEVPPGRWSTRLAHGLSSTASPSSDVAPASEADSPRVCVRLMPHGSLPVERLTAVTRGVWAGRGGVLMLDACSSGLDLWLSPQGPTLRVIAVPRPRARHRALALAAPGRDELLTRAVLTQYPVLWWAGTGGLVPLHVSSMAVGGAGVVLAGPGGSGLSTLVRDSTGPRARPVSDNLCTSDGHTLHGLREPVRLAQGSGPAMPHGRRESPLGRRVDSVSAERLLLIRRDGQPRSVAQLEPVSRAEAVRTLVAGTYAAGELRRYWAFAAAMALATGMGPAHPPITTIAEVLAQRCALDRLLLPDTPGTRLEAVLAAHPLQRQV